MMHYSTYIILSTLVILSIGCLLTSLMGLSVLIPYSTGLIVSFVLLIIGAISVTTD